MLGRALLSVLDFPAMDAGTGVAGGGVAAPPNLETVGALPPHLSSENIFSFHHIFNVYKDVLCRRQLATAEHIISLS